MDSHLGETEETALVIRVLHIINDLDVGGAEIALVRLLTSRNDPQYQHSVISLGTIGTLGPRLDQHGVPLQVLGNESNLVNPLKLFTLARWVKQSRPDIVHTWMYHANLVGGIVAKMFTRAPVVWSIRQDLSDTTWVKPRTMQVIRLGARLSAIIPSTIVSVSERAVGTHVHLGYVKDKFIFIPNGFEIGSLNPNPHTRSELKEELGLSKDALLIGFFARYHAIKDHSTFLAAAEIVHRTIPQAHFLLAGLNIIANNLTLMAEIEGRKLSSVIHLLGLRDDIPRLLSSLDLYTISSRSEGFPQSVCEAMAAGIPCVVTDVGDAAQLVGEAGLVVPPRDPEALALAWMQVLNFPEKRRKAIGELGRLRVIQYFSLDETLDMYYDMYSRVLENTLK